MFIQYTGVRANGSGSAYSNSAVATTVHNAYSLAKVPNICAKSSTYVVHTGDGASDLAGQMVGALVSSALVFKEYGNDTAYYDKLMTAAGGLYKQVRGTGGGDCWEVWFHFE